MENLRVLENKKEALLDFSKNHLVARETSDLDLLLDRQYEYFFKSRKAVVSTQASVLVKLSGAGLLSDDVIEALLAIDAYPLKIELESTPSMELAYLKSVNVGKGRYLKISVDNERFLELREKHLEENMLRLHDPNLGDFSVDLNLDSKKQPGCVFNRGEGFSSYECYNKSWDVVFKSVLSTTNSEKEFLLEEQQIKDKLKKEILILILLLVISLFAILFAVLRAKKTVDKELKKLSQAVETSHKSMDMMSEEEGDYAETFALKSAINSLILRLKRKNTKLNDINKSIVERAFTNPVTGLNNIFGLKHYLEKYELLPFNKLYAFYIDIDNFRYINENLGREIGDEVLKQIAQNLKILITSSKDMLVNISADEFIFIKEFEIEKDENQMLSYAQFILGVLNKAISIDDKDSEFTEQLSFTACIGVASTDKNTEFNDLLKKADTALGLAKTKGKARIQFFKEELESKKNYLIKTQRELRQSLKNKEFIFRLQPRVNVKTNKIEGAELLIRWLKDGEEVLPIHFLHIAQQSNLIIDLDFYAISEGLNILSILQEQNLSISINLSHKHLYDDRLIDYLLWKIKEHKIDARFLELEFKENPIMSTKENVAKLEAIKSLGLSLSMDDFGRGLSSLFYLTSLPFNVVKIDTITGMHKDAKLQALTECLINTCTRLGKKIIAKGVECQEELELLGRRPSAYQGFYYSKPLLLEEFLQLLKDESDKS